MSKLSATTMTKAMEMRPLTVISAAFSGGAPIPGSERGPQTLLDSGLKTTLQKSMKDVSFATPYQKLEVRPSSQVRHSAIKRGSLVSASSSLLSDTVYHCCREGRFPLTLGGDHSIAIGTLTGVARAIRDMDTGRRLSVVYVDAHADINTPDSSMSGYIHGMPLAFASGLAEAAPPFDWIKSQHLIDLSGLVYIGLRDIDEAEKRTIASHGIKTFDMDDVNRLGMMAVIDLALKHIAEDSFIHLSFDIDGLDPTFARSTGFPVEGGISLIDGCYIAERVRESGQLVAMDLVEVNPEVAKQDVAQTLSSARSVIYSALGITASGLEGTGEA